MTKNVSRFFREKSGLAIVGLRAMKNLRARGVAPRVVRYDNAGENKQLQKMLEKEEFGIDFQYTQAGTP